MTNEPSIDDLRWLVGTAAEPFLAEATARPGDLLRLSQRLRKTLSPERARLVVEQTALRHKARQKFAAPERMFFTLIGLQQSTDEFVARYKAKRFPAGPVADLCCGIGGDLLALGEQQLTVGIDRNPAVAFFARANCGAKLQRREQASIVVAAADQFRVKDFAAWHIDPDRRSLGRRKTHVEGYEPGPDVIDRLLLENPHGAVKLAPAAEIPEGWAEQSQQEWISRDGECKQLIAWFGNLAPAPGTRQASVLDSRGTVLASVVGAVAALPPLAKTVGQYVYEPDAALLAAQLVAHVAARHEMLPLIRGGGYLTGDVSVDEHTLTRFRVEAALPYRPKKIKALLAERAIGRLEVKKRGVDLEPEKVRSELRVEGAKQATLLLTRFAGQVIAVLAEREPLTALP